MSGIWDIGNYTIHYKDGKWEVRKFDGPYGDSVQLEVNRYEVLPEKYKKMLIKSKLKK